MNQGLVSIIMPAYNAGKYIRLAIESVLGQAYDYWELIIINDGSDDQTAEVIEHFNDPRIKVFYQANAGEAAARNVALGKITGEFLAFLDADDVFLPDHLQAAVQYFNIYPDVGGVYTDGYYCDESGQLLQSLSSRRRGPYAGDIFAELVRAPDVFGPPVCVVLRTHPIYQQNLRFDADIIIGPDWDFFLRFADRARFGYLDQVSCLYRIHKTNVTLLVQHDQRKVSLAKCRIKAIKQDRFQQCALDVRLAVFYDLLVNLLAGSPAKQMEILDYPEFAALPTNERARLLRLMASKGILADVEKHYITSWLTYSKTLNPGDRRMEILSLLFNISPKVSRIILKLKTLTQPKQIQRSPFGNVSS